MFFRFSGGRIDRGKLLSEEGILEVRMPVSVDRVPLGQQGKPIDEVIGVFRVMIHHCLISVGRRSLPSI
jgi:hypothetical protein